MAQYPILFYLFKDRKSQEAFAKQKIELSIREEAKKYGPVKITMATDAVSFYDYAVSPF